MKNLKNLLKERILQEQVPFDVNKSKKDIYGAYVTLLSNLNSMKEYNMESSFLSDSDQNKLQFLIDKTNENYKRTKDLLQKIK